MIFLLIWTPVQLQKPNVESITNQPTDTIEDSSPTAKVLKYGFCKKSLRKNETLTIWTLLAHFFSRSSVQLVTDSFFRSDILQNPYFK